MNRSKVTVAAACGAVAGVLAACGAAGAVALDGLLQTPPAAAPASPPAWALIGVHAPPCGGGWTSGPDEERAVRARGDVNCP